MELNCFIAGDSVEIIKTSKLITSFHPATILLHESHKPQKSTHKNKRKRKKHDDTSSDDDDEDEEDGDLYLVQQNDIVSYVSSNEIRPIPPRNDDDDVRELRVNDKVDVLRDGYWIKGTIVGVLYDGTKYVVGIDGHNDDVPVEVCKSYLRIHRHWSNASWFPPINQKESFKMDPGSISRPEAISQVKTDSSGRRITLKFKANKTLSKTKFSPGTLVEVRSDEDGYRGSWYAATIVHSVGIGKFLVEYETLTTEDEMNSLRETANEQDMRPRPPHIPRINRYNVLDEVDAWYNDGWWEGSIYEVLDDRKYIVYFATSNEKLVFQHSDLRCHQNWVDEKWIIPLQMAGNNGKGKHLTPQQKKELSGNIRTRGRHVHSRGVTMSAREEKAKGLSKRPRGDILNTNGVETVARMDDETLESHNDSPVNMDTSEYHDAGHTPIGTTHEGSARTDTTHEESADDATDTNIPMPDVPPIHTSSVEHYEMTSSLGSVHRKKDSRGRFVGSEVASCSAVKNKKVNSWVLREPMPGGPVDIRLLKSYGGHVAGDIWEGNSRGVLMGVNRSLHCRQLSSWRNNMTDEVESLVDGAERDGFSFLVDCLFDHLDMPLLSAFVERWQPDTNTFHLPFGEMTITLHDVFHILRLPIDGRLVEYEEQGGSMVVEVGGILRKTPQQMVRDKVYKHGGVLTSSIIASCGPDANRTPEVEASGFLMAFLGTTLFPDKTKTRVNPTLYTVVKNLDMFNTYSWGSATLAYLYRQLGIASRSQCKILGGCLSLLQAWIYEYFHKFRPQRSQLILEQNMPRVLAWDVKVENKHNIRLETFRKMLDDYTADHVTWLPFGPDQHIKVPKTTFEGYIRYFDIIEPYMPDRVLRQLGFKQSIPKRPFGYDDANRPASSHKYLLKISKSNLVLWDRFSHLALTDSMRASDPSNAIDPGYIDWYFRVSHPFLMPPTENADREPDLTSGEWCWEHYVDMSMEWLSWNLDEVQPPNLRDLVIRQREHMLKYLTARGITQPQPPPT